MRWPTVLGGKRRSDRELRWHWVAGVDGVEFRAGPPVAGSLDGVAVALTSPDASALLDQLAAEDLAEAVASTFVMTWEQVHEFARSKAYASSFDLLQLPPAAPLVPRLYSRGSLTDDHFTIGIAGWSDHDGAAIPVDLVVGGIVRSQGELALLDLPVWRLLHSIEAFAQRPTNQRTSKSTRRDWGRIRALAVEANARLDDFLTRSVVLSPEQLDLAFRRVEVGGANVVEVMPGFEGAPARWLEHFDKALGVPERFDIPTPTGAVHVALSAPVREVLGEIKRWPGRRIAGARAEAFLLNPFAALGDSATAALDGSQIAAAKEAAGLSFDRFRPVVEVNCAGYPHAVGIDIDAQDGSRSRRPFEDNEALRAFITALKGRLARGLQLLAWQGFELELDGEAGAHLATLEKALAARDAPAVLVRRDQVFDIENYYERVTGIGESQPFISAYIVKRSNDEGWFPSNLLPVIRVVPPAPEPEVAIPLAPHELPDIRDRIDAARKRGDTTVVLPGHDAPLPLDEVAASVSAFERALRDPEPVQSPAVEPSGATRARPTLLIKGNIETVDYRESQADQLRAEACVMEPPAALKGTMALRQHQIAGIARLQHLFKLSPEHCRGVLLADDMGLGKTLQLLTFLAWAFERRASLAPALIVAPVSLLQNWQQEVARFFIPGSLKVMTAYGEQLMPLRVPRSGIDAELQKDGLVAFLKPGWRGDANLVLTTYETLRDLEFSFAREDWSVMVCDEAQKIKNPNALVTRAAKKLKVRFRVACTGTPVENSLADLWCLFDYIQPGLLGGLNDFGRTYGHHIESGAGEGKLEQLRQLIAPQVIRRTKAEVAKDLPRKIEVAECRVPMSNEQRALYVGALRLFSEPPADEDQSRRNHLGLLAHLRLVCADPRRHGIESFAPDELSDYRRKAPKMDWLLGKLQDIRARGEKALVFAEHRELQRLLQHYIKSEFGFAPRIVNGDTSVSAKAEVNRQKVIDDFQASSGFNVIILSPLAVGFGLNIQAANHVIHYLRHWNPAKEDQATDRAYRIGQTRSVHVYCPLTIADDFKTFDVKLDELLRRKRSLAGDMLRGASSVAASDFDLSEIAPDADRTLRNQPVTLDMIERSAPNFFEALVAVLWQRQGFRCQLTQQSDAGVDVVGLRDGDGVLLQCKSSTSSRQLGWEAVKDVAAGAAVYGERHPGVRFRRYAVTNQAFNARAHDRARATGVTLVEQERLATLLSEHPIGTLDVLAVLSAPRI